MPLQGNSITALTKENRLLVSRTVRGLLGQARAPAGAPPFWVIRTKTTSFFSAAGAMVFLTATISLWVRTAVFVLAVAGRTAVALETSARKTTVAMRKRRDMLQRYCACVMAR